MTKNRTPTPVYLDPGMHPGLEVKGLMADYRFSRCLYSLTATGGYNTSFILTNRAADLGNTSWTFKSTISDKNGQEELATLLYKSVLVDMKTRRPTRVPQVIRDKLKDVLTGDKIEMFDRLTLHPSSAVIVCQFEVQPSDIDSNGHMNNISYITICHDAVSKASCQNRLRGVTSDIARLNVERMSVIYLSEVRMGDMIDAYVWQEKDENELFIFRLRSCSTNKLILECSMKFYSAQSAL